MPEPSPCADAGHSILSLFLVRCDHVGETILYRYDGTAESPSALVEVRYGPFDGRKEVLDDVIDVVRGSQALPPG